MEMSAGNVPARIPADGIAARSPGSGRVAVLCYYPVNITASAAVVDGS